MSRGQVKEESDDCKEDPKLNLKVNEDDYVGDEIIESDIELDGEVVDPDNGPPQKMGDPSIEVPEESLGAAQMSKTKGLNAISEGKLDEAIEHLTEAILFNPSSAILYATRGSVFVKMKKPNAAIRDSNAALEINPNSAKGYKTRGMAKALLGKWEEAASDLHIASELDHDEEIYSVLKKVEPNVRKIEVHRRKYERLRKERERKKVESEWQRRRPEAQRGHVKEESDDCEADPKLNLKSDDDVGDEIIESDIELDGEVVDPDNDPPQKMGDPSIEVSEESLDAAQMSKTKGLNAISEGKLDEAIGHLTEAILFNPSSAILYATRASVFVKMNKPNAAIRDSNAALEINPDSAKGYKTRGMAKALLGKWEEAASDLHVASKLDHDEEIYSVLKKVEPNVHKIEEHRRKYERLRMERDMKKAETERQRCRPEAQAECKGEEQHSESKAFQHAELKGAHAQAALQDGHVINIHSSNELETKFRAASSLSRVVILYFTATWCGPCRFMAPLYKSLAEQYRKVVFLKLDIDELADVARSWDVNSVPSFFFVKDGKQIDKVVGADKNGLERKITLHAGKP